MKRMEELSVVLSLKGRDIPSLMKELLLKVTDLTLPFFHKDGRKKPYH